MKNKKIWLGILAITLVFTMTAVGCGNSDDTTDDNNSTTGGGTFTLINIPSEYNNKYAGLMADNNRNYILGVESYNRRTDEYTFSKISSGKVTIPLWSDDYVSVRYSGNDTLDVLLYIFDDSKSNGYAFSELEFYSVKFSNGSATRTWSQGTWPDSGLDGTWKADLGVGGGTITFTMKIAKDNFEVTASSSDAALATTVQSFNETFAGMKGDKVSTSGYEITVQKERTDIGKADYSISRKELSLSNGTGIFAGIEAISRKWTKYP